MRDFYERCIMLTCLSSYASDLYSIIKYDPLLPTEHKDPMNYQSVGTRTLDDRESTVDDICDFIVEYINSDVLVGLFRIINLFGLSRCHFFLGPVI